MPFVDQAGQPLRTIHLAQTPADGRYFQLERPIGFQEHPGDDIIWAPAHIPDDRPPHGNRTDLASVPWVLWNFVASYGRQTAPALVHDHRSQLATTLAQADALAQRFEDDRVFRVGLRQQKVPLLRAWLMWAFVCLERYWRHAKPRFFLILAQLVVGVVVVYSAIIGGLGQPLLLLLIAVPAVAALVWRREAPLMVWTTYAGAFLTPLLALQLCLLVPYWLAELFARELIDRPFIDPEPGPIAVPFGKAP